MEVHERTSGIVHQAPDRVWKPNDAAAVGREVDRIREANRIHITGSPGSGKSTLARRLGAYRGVAVVALDSVAYTGADFADRDLHARLSEVKAISERPEWISEGIFVGWTDPLLEKADLIIWLDYLSWPGAVLRLLKRTVRGAYKEMRARRGAERFLRFDDYWRHMRQLMSVVVTSREYWREPSAPHSYPVTRENIEAVLEPLNPKVLHVTGRRQARHLLDTVSSPALAELEEEQPAPPDRGDEAEHLSS
jgi:adenylate kinase family enzyme